MTALPRLQAALEAAAAEPARKPRRWPALAAVSAVAAVAVVAVRPAPDPEVPATPPVRVEIGRPVPPEPAGEPPEGQIELRAGGIAGLYFEKDGMACFEHGPDRIIRSYPVHDGGSCLQEATADPLTWGVGWSRGGPVVVHGFARPEVERLEIDGPGGRYAVPRSEHGFWFVAYPERAGGEAVVTAYLQDGGTRRATVSLSPPEMPEITEGPRPDDPVMKLRASRPADVEEFAITPSTGGPDTTFELAVPAADPRGLYAVQLDGPAGRECAAELDEGLGVTVDDDKGRIQPIPPHRQAPGKTIDMPGFSEDLRTAPWCPGHYRLRVRRVEYKEKGRGRDVAELTFVVR
jgi:hypothetical protein